MYIQKIDINVDVGEGIGNEAELMPFISSCNIACGGHAGDFSTMQEVVKLAKLHKVKIGAHPSYPDKANFGRVKMDISCAALYTSLKKQIDDLSKVVHDQRVVLHHIKPHGALYNLAAVNEKVANVIIEVMKSLVLPIKLYVPYKSVIAQLAIENKIAITYEAFADRNYNDDLSLVSRNEKYALIEDATALFNHVFYMISDQKVRTVQNSEIQIIAETFCIHGDNPNAVSLVSKLKDLLEQKGIKIR